MNDIILMILGMILLGIFILMPVYVFFDTRTRGKEHPGIWALASWCIPLVWIYWLLIRPPKIRNTN